MAQSELITLVRAVVRYDRTTGLSADQQTNTFYVGSDINSDEDDVAVKFTTAVSILLDAIDARMENDMFITPVHIDYFSMLDEEPRIPFRTDSHAQTFAGTDASLPLEVSCCLSFEGAEISGVNQQRRRGRVYLPTFTTANVEMVSGRVQWTSACRTSIATAASAMKAALLADSLSWTVYSPKTADETLGNLLAKAREASTYVLRGWVDTEPDIQRRRGGPGGVKNIWT